MTYEKKREQKKRELERVFSAPKKRRPSYCRFVEKKQVGRIISEVNA